MKLRRFLKILILMLFLCLVISIGAFLYNANHTYNVNNGFTPLTLNFNPYDSSSTYDWNNAEITVYGGFIKGIQNDGSGNKSLIIRALSPMPTISLKAMNAPIRDVSIIIENINPKFYAENIKKGFNPVRTTVNTLKFDTSLSAKEEKIIEPIQPQNIEDDKYVILGDSRNGYENFRKIIEQVNGLKPIFVIDNGDLVFSGKPNQYRLFDRIISQVSTTMCTTLGNHDIRDNGRQMYTKLYGPNYYSFDFGYDHFTFLDSSPGWSNKRAISEEQYSWLEKDLKKAQGKKIYVITHVPPEDPRSGTKPNNIQYYIDKEDKENGFFEQKLENYSENESMNHGFQDKNEAKRFETLMTKYKVSTVYLSHIHSYFDYSKNGVRYIISGGAGAELLTQNSYYHYLVSRFDNRNSITMVQLPSPANALLKRYISAAQLFAQAMYDENRTAVIFFIIGIILLVFVILLFLFIKLNHRLMLLWRLMRDTGRYTSKRFKELFKKDE